MRSIDAYPRTANVVRSTNIFAVLGYRPVHKTLRLFIIELIIRQRYINRLTYLDLMPSY